MKHVSLFKKYFFSFAICFFQGALSIVIGSFTVPSTQSFVTFPSADADNEMRGFASFDGGFALANNRTSCLFTSLCPVSRTIDLRLGKLALNTDLYLGDTVNFISTGTFIGNNNFIYTPAINEPLVINAAQTLSLTASVLVGLPVNSIDWNFSDQYVAAATNFSASAPELYTYSFNGGPLLSQVASTTFNFSALAVRFHPTLNYLQTSIASDIATNDTFAYRFNTSPNYLVQTGGDVLSGSGYAVAWNPRGSWVAASSDTSQYPDQAQLRIFNFNSGTGALSLLTTGTLTPIRNVQPNAMNWDSTGQYLVIGVNANATVGANELLLYYFNDTTLTSTNGVDLGRTVTAVDYSPSGTFIAAGLSAGTESLRIYRHTISNGTLVEEPSARVGETVTVNSVDWHPTGNYLATGLSTSGGSEIRVYRFNSTNVTLTLAAQIDSTSSINEVRWSRSGTYLAVADANLTVSIYRLIDVPLVLNNVKLTMNGDLTLALPVETYGFVEIDGQEYTLDLSLSPTVSVFPGSTLVLKNMMVTGISGSKINNVDNTGQVQLQNTTWVQSGDYQFVRGSLQINNKVLMTGASNFVYQTSQISTITSNAQLMFDSGMTFSYAPSSASNNLLNFQDSTAELYLYQTTLRTSTIGLQLTKGMVTVDGICNVVSNAVTQAQGVRFGDGVLSANNINLMILPESGLNLVSGFLVYNNV